jgi:signal transduction histidine kinase
MTVSPAPLGPSRWELAAENIAVRIRWFGLLIGYLIVNLGMADDGWRPILNAILTLGAVYAVIDTYQSLRGRVFLGRFPLIISAMEALFIGLLCYCHGGLESPFRYYYFLSLICCAIRHSRQVTYVTCGLHCASVLTLYIAQPVQQQQQLALLLMLVVLGWVTWASNAMGLLVKSVGEHLSHLNGILRENQAQLEERITERTRDLQEAQARLLHQEKMAAFGLLAAGIAHEVGNPLTSISTLVQMLQRRDCDAYTAEKLQLVSGQLQRIQGTLREVINFSRPASSDRTRFTLSEIVEEALNIAKYYKRTKGRTFVTSVPPQLPLLTGVRDQFVQVLLNLVLNAIDATEKGGKIELIAAWVADAVEVMVRDDGCGIAQEHRDKVFQPYFTTKQNGTGLGLFVTQQLMQDNGGTVEFQSSPGQGTVFLLRFPIATEEGTERVGAA